MVEDTVGAGPDTSTDLLSAVAVSGQPDVIEVYPATAFSAREIADLLTTRALRSP